VVVPALNERGLLPACLTSIASTVPDERPEIIVVDAGSTDGTVDLASSAGAIVLQVPKSTIAAQRNRGAAAAKHELIAFLDADCTVLPGWSENAILQFALPDVVSVGAPPQVPRANITWVQSTWSYISRSLSDGSTDVHWLPSANVWVRKSRFQEVGGFDESLETCEDADLGFRLSRMGRIVCNPNVAVVHHREPRTLTKLYKKELWHGKNNYSGMLKGRLTPAELPSLLAPVIFGFFAILLAAGLLLTPTSDFVIASVGGLCSLPAVYTIRAVLKKGEARRVIQVFIVYFVYFAARTHAAVSGLVHAAMGVVTRPKSAPAQDHDSQ
jgi:glycosyltransferase involved in cell wall biosynthesis